MNFSERTTKLYDAARSKGMDGPSDTMIETAIADAETQREQDIIAALISGGFTEAIDYLERKNDLAELDDIEEQMTQPPYP